MEILKKLSKRLKRWLFGGTGDTGATGDTGGYPKVIASEIIDSINDSISPEKIINKFNELVQIGNAFYLSDISSRTERNDVQNHINKVIQRNFHTDMAQEAHRYDLEYRRCVDTFNGRHDEYNNFKKKNSLNRLPSNILSYVKYFSVLFLLVIIESTITGFFLLSASDKGLLGASFIASIFSLFNVFINFLFGILFKYKNHIVILKKLFGFFIIFVFILFAITFNITLGHFREIFELSSLDLAFSKTFGQVKSNFFGIYNLQSWALVIIGCLISIYSFKKGYSFNDTYPGYSNISKKWNEAHEDMNSLREEYGDSIKKKKDEFDAFLNNKRSYITHEQNLNGERVQYIHAANQHYSNFKTTIANEFLKTVKKCREENFCDIENNITWQFKPTFDTDKLPELKSEEDINNIFNEANNSSVSAYRKAIKELDTITATIQL